MVLDLPIKLEDLEAVDVEYYNSLTYVLENNPEPLCLTFEVRGWLRQGLRDVAQWWVKGGGSSSPELPCSQAFVPWSWVTLSCC